MTWEVAQLSGCRFEFDQTIHIRPVGDVLEHGHVDCECMPALELVRGITGWGLKVVHKAIDGRSHDNPPLPPPEAP